MIRPADSWGLTRPRGEYRENVAANARPIELDADVKRLIYGLTEIDHEIYEIAKARSDSKA